MTVGHANAWPLKGRQASRDVPSEHGTAAVANRRWQSSHAELQPCLALLATPFATAGLLGLHFAVQRSGNRA